MQRGRGGGNELGAVDIDRAAVHVGDHAAGFLHQQDRGGDVPDFCRGGPIAVKPAGRQITQVQCRRAHPASGLGGQLHLNEVGNLRRLACHARRKADGDHRLVHLFHATDLQRLAIQPGTTAGGR
jgi:hypothetical protein